MNAMPPIGTQCRPMTDRDKGLCYAIKGLKLADPGKVRHRTRVVMPEWPNIRPKPRGETIRTVLVKCGARLPIHLAHPLKDEHAVVIHALGPSLQGSR